MQRSPSRDNKSPKPKEKKATDSALRKRRAVTEEPKDFSINKNESAVSLPNQNLSSRENISPSPQENEEPNATLWKKKSLTNDNEIDRCTIKHEATNPYPFMAPNFSASFNHPTLQHLYLHPYFYQYSQLPLYRPPYSSIIADKLVKENIVIQ